MRRRNAARLPLVSLLSSQVCAFDTQAIDTCLTEQMVELEIPGAAVAIVQDGRTVRVRGYGDTGSGTAVGPDTPFGLAPVTKRFTALSVMQLVEAGDTSHSIVRLKEEHRRPRNPFIDAATFQVASRGRQLAAHLPSSRA